MKKPYHICCIDMYSLQCILKWILNWLYLRKFCHNDCSDMVSTKWMSSYVLGDEVFVRKLCHNNCIGIASPQCVSTYVSLFTTGILISFYPSYSMWLQMDMEQTIPWKSLFTMVAFMWLLSSVYSQVDLYPS